MSNARCARRWALPVVATTLLALTLPGCSGSDGKDGAPGADGSSATSTVSPSSVSALNMTVTGVTINSAPVVTFTAVDQNGKPVTGLKNTNVYFTIAKLLPGTDGNPSRWQNYVNTTQTASAPGAPKPISSAVQATRENTGTLVDHGDGTYTYTFSKDIKAITAPVAVPYEPTLTHRVAIQLNGVNQADGTPVRANAVYTFRPSDGATTGLHSREIVKTETCNQCHNRLVAHGGRIDTKFCVMCHNPGTTDPDSGHTVDFKVMVHKIHRGSSLPSVLAGTPYAIWGHQGTRFDFSTVGFPQDIRNCTKCHDGSDPATPQGGNWATQPSMEACGSCHDDVKFDVAGPAAGGTDPNGHPGGAVSSNSECTVCHGEGKFAGSVQASHSKGTSLVPSSPWVKQQAAKFKFNILSITNTAPGQFPVIAFSVTDPTNGNAPYDVKSHPAFVSSPSFLLAWNTKDFNNETRSRAQAVSIGNVVGPSGSAVANGDGTFTVTSTTAIPATATGTGRVAMQGYLAGDTGSGYSTANRVAIDSAILDFAITDPTPVARRKVVDAAKCNQCHDRVQMHGGSRVNEPQLCVMCHNPNATDVDKRRYLAGWPNPVGPDQKKEEAIDFKRMIHGIHAGAKTNYDGTAGHGFRNKGLVVYGHVVGGVPTEGDFSHIRFPGILQDCQTCHLPGTYTLAGKWGEPVRNGILASTIDTAPLMTAWNASDPALTDATDDLNITPTAAVCSSCHDGGPAKTHMEQQGALFTAVQSAITREESCAVCHGPGRDFDVEKVHARR